MRKKLPKEEMSLLRTKEAGSLTNGHTRDWKPFLSQYSDKRLLRFPTDGDLEAAIDLLWSGEFRQVPHDTPDGKSLIVPAEAVHLFLEAGLRFSEQKLRSITELPAPQIQKTRR